MSERSERFACLLDTLKERGEARYAIRCPWVRPQLIVRYRESISENILLVMFQTFNHNEGSVWQLRFLHKGLKENHPFLISPSSLSSWRYKCNVKGTVALCLTILAPHHEDVWGSGCIMHSFLTSALGSKWSDSRPGRFTPAGITLAATGQEAGWGIEQDWTLPPARNRTSIPRSPSP
jgi:hypothetical protein